MSLLILEALWLLKDTVVFNSHSLLCGDGTQGGRP